MMQIQKQCVHFEDHFELEIDNVFVSGSLNKHFKDSLAEQLGMDILDIAPPIQRKYPTSSNLGLAMLWEKKQWESQI